jgi:hypothetical protein
MPERGHHSRRCRQFGGRAAGSSRQPRKPTWQERLMTAHPLASRPRRTENDLPNPYGKAIRPNEASGYQRPNQDCEHDEN